MTDHETPAPEVTDDERETLVRAVLEPDDDCAHNFAPLFAEVERILARRTPAPEARPDGFTVGGRFVTRDDYLALTSALEFGDDGFQSPAAHPLDLIGPLTEMVREADEWRESQQWRVVCALAGHPDDEDCHEHDPALRLLVAEARPDDDALAAAWSQGMRTGTSRAMRHMSDEPNLPLASEADNPYLAADTGEAEL